MGYDYYIRNVIEVVYIDDEMDIIVVDRKGYYDSFDYDSDSENDYDRKETEYYNNIKRSLENKTKTIFANSQWLITSEEKMRRYQDLIKDFDNVKKIYKKYLFSERL